MELRNELTMDDLEVGLVILPVDRRDENDAVAAEIDAHPVQMLVAEMKQRNEPNIKGHPFEIIAMNLPYIAVRPIEVDTDTTISVDTREWHLMRCNRDFTEALRVKRSWFKRLIPWM